MQCTAWDHQRFACRQDRFDAIHRKFQLSFQTISQLLLIMAVYGSFGPGFKMHLH
ncbi:hypothetical protein D3C73_1577230 [compost metagenome]